MRWLYRILRLFKCPHRWEVEFKNSHTIHDGVGVPIANYYNWALRCKYCGDIKHISSRSN